MIREATIEDLRGMYQAAQEFAKSSAFIREINFDLFVDTWKVFLETGVGVIFVVLDVAGNIVGSLGGVAYPDINSGKMVASEFFWFVMEKHRGDGVQLLRMFVQWAQEKKCSSARVCHMIDSMPDRLATIYKRMGFNAIEVHYSKELMPCQ